MVVEPHQSFQLLRLNTCFLKNNKALPKFLYGTLHYMINIVKLQKIVP